MKTTYLFGLVLAVVSNCYGQQTVVDYDWQKLSSSGQLAGGTPITVDSKSALKIVSAIDSGLRVQVLRITNPPVTRMLYAIAGEIKYEGVKGDGFLEMWNCFPPQKFGGFENKYFSRTLGESGELGKITGTSNWRPFTLPFDRTGSTEKPTRLEINLILPAQGTVYLGPIKLVEYEGNLGLQKQAGAWWSDRTAGWIGGIGGSLLGCLGSLLAVLASKGRCRGFVVATSLALIGIGLVVAVVGVAAVVIGQPYGVWFPLVLGGALLLAILPFRLRQFQKGYEDLELRRMASMDA